MIARWTQACIAGLVVLGTWAVAAGQEEIGRWFNPRFGQMRIAGDYSVRHWCQRSTDQPGRSLRATSHQARVSAPLFQDECQELALRTRVGVWDMDTAARLPQKGVALPDHLWDVAFGATYRRKLENDWIVGADAEVGSASDQPFYGADEMSVKGTAWLTVPASGRNAWVFLVSYSNVRSFLPHAPLPGVAYSWRPSEKLHWLVGFPFTRVHWQPIEKLELEGSYVFPRTIHAKASYRVIEKVKLYAGYDWDNRVWYRAGRGDYYDRLFYYEQRVSAGVRWDITDNVYADLHGGYAFDRVFFEGEDYDDRFDNDVDLGDTLFAGLRVGVKF